MRSRVISSFITALILLGAVSARALVFWATDPSDTKQLTSLRGEIIFANRIGGNNTILLGPLPDPWFRQTKPYVYHLTIQGANEDQAQSGDLDVTRGNLTIIGAAPNVVIDATGLGDRVFQVFSNASLTLVNVTITGGTAPVDDPTTTIPVGADYEYDESISYGGAIFNSGRLNLQNCSIIGNSSGAGGIEGDYLLYASPGGSGGGIYNAGSAYLNNCIVESNETGNGTGVNGFASGGGNGGGVFNGGSMVLGDSIIISNSCGIGGGGGIPIGGLISVGTPDLSSGGGGGGGGVFNTGSMTISYSTIAKNRAGDGGNSLAHENSGDGGSGGDGGGVFNSGNLVFNTSTVSGNIAGDGGVGADGSVEAGGSGGNGGNAGGIYNSGTLSLSACTIVINQAGVGAAAGDTLNPVGYVASPAPSGGQGGSGGGLFNAATGTNVVVRDSLIALNIPNVGGAGSTNQIFQTDPPETVTIIGAVGTTGIGYEVNGAFTSLGFNLISTGDGSTGFTNGVNSDHVGTDANPINPVLGPLQWNGGPTPTHALLSGSPAINQGFDFGAHFDQRGYRRPYLYPGIPKAKNGDGGDIGAFELEGH